MAEEHATNVIEIKDFRETINREHEALSKPPLQGGDGGGTFDGMEPRVAKVEAAIEYIQRDIADIKGDVRTLRDNARTDFRLLFGAIITVAVGLAGLLAKGFHWF